MDVDMATEEVELVEKLELDGDMESWVELVFLDAAYWILKQQEEEKVLAWGERQGEWVKGLREGRYLQSQC